MTDRRTPAQVIARAVAASSHSVEEIEKAAGVRQGDLQSYLNGSDIEASSLVAAGGLLGVTPESLYQEAS